jgi:hypothetical protein
MFKYFVTSGKKVMPSVPLLDGVYNATRRTLSISYWKWAMLHDTTGGFSCQ